MDLNGVDRKRVDCVGAVVVDERGRLLLVLRGHEPAKGCWSVPGGRVEPGETDAAATAREVLEETGLRVEARRLVGTVERDAPDGSTYVIRDYACIPVHGCDPPDLHAGDDAEQVGWFSPEQVRALSCSPGLVDVLEEWGVLTADQHR